MYLREHSNLRTNYMCSAHCFFFSVVISVLDLGYSQMTRLVVVCFFMQ